MRLRNISSVFLVLGLSSLLLISGVSENTDLGVSATSVVPEVATVERSPVFEPGSVLFLGDMFLGRRVETYMNRYGTDYPFASTTDLLSTHSLTVVNFEGAAPDTHVPTPELAYQFSVPQEYFETIREAGIDVLSLANNHAYDHGASGYHETEEACARYNLVCRGHPYTIATSSIEVFSVGSTTVGIIFLHTLFAEPDEAVLRALVTRLTRTSDVQFAYVHWGTEYERTHNDDQEALAQMLIDDGIDAVIGHHPHVVQDIALYRGKPIFYSLGNYVFDQFFSDDVQVGLGVVASFSPTHVEYTLIPVSSLVTRSQPQVADAVLQTELFDRTLSRYTSIASDVVDVKLGKIIASRDELKSIASEDAHLGR